MPVVFLDGADHYATVDLNKKYSIVAGTATINATAGRRGGGCIVLPWNGTTNYVERGFSASASWIVGFALHSDTLTGQPILSMRDAGTAQIDVRLDTNGALSVLRGATVLGATPAGSVVTGSYTYIEVRAVIHPTAGAVEIRLNGSATAALSLSNINTRATSNSSADSIRFVAGGVNFGTSCRFDDIYIIDASGAPNAFLGDTRIDAYRPNAAGSSTAFATRVGAASNFQAVNQTNPDGDTSYVEDATVGDRDLYSMADMTHSAAQVHAVQVVATALKSDAGARSLALPVKSGETVSAGPGQALSTAYVMYRRVLETDPATGAAWTRDAVNALEAGIEVV